MSKQKIRVLVAKVGLDSHDRGAKVIARALRDSGLEVIYMGLHNTPAQIVESALQEDVDVIVLSSLAGAHMTLFIDVYQALQAQGLDIPILGGGVIPDDDATELVKLGIKQVMGPGTSLEKIVQTVRVIAHD